MNGKWIHEKRSFLLLTRIRCWIVDWQRYHGSLGRFTKLRSPQVQCPHVFYDACASILSWIWRAFVTFKIRPKSAGHDPQHASSPKFLSNPLWFWYQTFSNFFFFFWLLWWYYVWVFQIPNTLGEINGNVAWKLENVVTTLNKIIDNISIIFSYLILLNKIQVCSCFIVFQRPGTLFHTEVHSLNVKSAITIWSI